MFLPLYLAYFSISLCLIPFFLLLMHRSKDDLKNKDASGQLQAYFIP